MNQMRGFLLERGVTMRKGPSHLAAQLQILLHDRTCCFSGRTQGLLLELKHEWNELERRIEEASAEIQRIAKQDDVCIRLMEIPGIGPLVSTALVAWVGNAITFRKGRDKIPFGFARQINVCVNGQNQRCSNLSGNANF